MVTPIVPSQANARLGHGLSMEGVDSHISLSLNLFKERNTNVAIEMK